MKTWFGYTVHLIADTEYELPVSFRVTTASESEVVNARRMIDDIGKDDTEILERCEYFIADRGHDDTKLITKLEGHGISPVIDIRNCWQAPPETTRPLDSDMHVTHTFDGKVFCSCGLDEEEKRMVCRGYEKDRDAIKYGCPAKYYGVTCPCKGHVRNPEGAEDPAGYGQEDIHPRSARQPQMDKKYDMRSALKRVNSRLDNLFGFENHTSMRNIDKQHGIALE